jgi:glycogen debranching enzyme
METFWIIQLGSIWAHDNGIIALGCKRYGFATAAARIARGISEAGSYFENYRLPEVYAGIAQQKGALSLGSRLSLSSTAGHSRTASGCPQSSTVR